MTYPALSILEYFPTIREMHILAVALCLLLAVLADLRAAKLFVGPLSEWDVKLLDRYHALLSAGVAVLWSTGFVLIGELTGFELAKFSPKLIAKVAVVVILTLNARLIGALAFRTMVEFPTLALGAVPARRRILMCVVSLVSFVSWSSATALGAIAIFKPMSASELTEIFGSAYMMAIAGGFVMAAVAAIIARILGHRPRSYVREHDAVPTPLSIPAE